MNLIERLKHRNRGKTHWEGCEKDHIDCEILVELERKDQRIERLEGQQVWLFNQGYGQGHHDTVEGMYVDVLPEDSSEYHDDIVKDLLEEALSEDN